ncbi:MAG: flagellar export protein FliJ [Gammaproteobacteria bacterium HGW-Gammaproteobacteria-3]|nr:MAG: flagellar export protein FliJ [Gammaproteobacteria bacterium HGW-Gammaproteobacteria-3]
MKKSDRLKTLIELNVEQEKKALEAFGAAQRKQVQLQQQLDDLSRYRLDYQIKFDAFRGGARIGQVLEFRVFIDKLNQAIAGQEQVLQQLNEELEKARSHWLSVHHRNQGLQKIRNEALADEIKQQDKREQAELDDRASGKRRNNLDGMGNA